jgi:hypothetical protein
MKTQEDVQTESGSSQNREAANLGIEQAFDQEVTALLAYFYWEARGCPHDSPHEDWFRAEAELRNRIAAAATA